MQESFSSAAGRHLRDASTLLQVQRWDNAVYLAGYVVECAFKLLIEQYFTSDGSAVKKYGHNLTELEGKAMERLRILYPILDKQLPASRTLGTVLSQHHPERRYAESGLWTESEAKLAVQRAEEIYREIVPKLVLNGAILSKDI
jgi:HEPN domain-containing protein